MEFPPSEERSAFSIWLRTGRWPDPVDVETIEVKYNPWHDPDNGQFTFAGTGRYYPPSTARGGSYGGAGATGTWSQPNDRSKTPKSTRPKVPPARPIVLPKAGGADAPAIVSGRTPAVSVPAPVKPTEPEFQTIVRNGYEYHIDKDKRTRRVTGTLTTNDAQRRSRAAQSRAGGTDRLTTDDGGHYIARRFNGPTEAFNHFAQDANFNRSGYRLMEEQWARELRKGSKVTVEILPAYDGRSQRPRTIHVWFTVNGKTESQKFPNARKEPNHAE